ncbi:PQQ-binding-like beta-propeller repeat protein [Paractinoplanes rhizophilus]|uniref:PQQ-binding-like beta-propeller repeat protein n=1 Tax=Paractinoplanes rhizophilus TaxID=1416877 RepID=A0ABW2HKT7_9ACTN|nr:PQQ-binding-like beta-propeller repeat protein [Actinoplanes sp.]
MSRVLLRSLFALAVVAAAVLIGWRVLKPAEVLATVRPPLAPARMDGPGATGQLATAPLIVAGQVRVYASKRQVRADAPVDAKTVYTAVWSFRRWPEQLSGVVASGATVVSRWSDGDLVAIDGATGRIVWRAAGPPGPGFEGHRTGSATVWAPAGLRVAGPSVLVTAGGQLFAYAMSTGTPIWSATCAQAFTTAAAAQVVCPSGVFDAATGAPVASFPPGPYTPVGCDVASSSCAGLRDGAGHGWLTTSPAPVRATPLDRPDADVAAGLVVDPDGHAVDAVTGAARHDYPAGTQVLGASSGRAVLLTPDRTLLAVDPRTGVTIASFPLVHKREGTDWDPGRWQVTERYVAVERLRPDRPDDPDTPGYYFSADPVVVAAI